VSVTIGTPQQRAISRGSAARRVVATSPAAHWPLTVLMIGFPLWWILGLGAILPVLLAGPMAMQLLRRRPVRVPAGFGWWLLFLLWVAASVLVLQVDAPGAVPGGDASRLIVYGYRLLWYLACSVVLLWVCNLDEDELPTRHILRLGGWMFVFTVLGGTLGVVAPRFEVTSLVEMVVPQHLRSNDLIGSIVHPAAANNSSFLGRDHYRPIAPFAFANSWGSNLAMFLPFFLLSWFGRSAGWRRRLAPFVLVLAAIPIVFSLNRGLWLSLGLGVLVVVVRLALSGRGIAVLGATICLVTAAVVFLASPLASLSTERLENPHSNDRRGELLSETVTNTLSASPIIGFGSTRDVQGNFASIAGGSTPDCPACGVPPFGTQGQLWLVVYSQGIVGTALFLAFFVTQWVRNLRVRSPVVAAGQCILLFFALQMFIYDTLGTPLYAIMIAIALMWRERQRIGERPLRPPGTLESHLRVVRDHRAVFAGLVVLGAVIGGIVAVRQPTTYTARVSILLSPSPVFLGVTENDNPPDITVDTEAALLVSERAIDGTRDAVGFAIDGEDLRDRIEISAPPNTRVLSIDVSDADPTRAEQLAPALSASYLEVREEFLAQRRVQVLQSLRNQLDAIVSLDPLNSETSATPADEDVLTMLGLNVDEEQIRDAIAAVTLVPASAGEVIRSGSAERDRTQWAVFVVSGALLGVLAAVVGRSGRSNRRRSSAPGVPSIDGCELVRR